VETDAITQSDNIVIGSAALLKGTITDAQSAMFVTTQIGRLASGSSLSYADTEFADGDTDAISIPAGVTLIGGDSGNTWEDTASVTLGEGAVFTPGASATLAAATSITIGTGAKLDFTTGTAFNISAANSIRSTGTGKVVVTTKENLAKVLAKATTEDGEILTVEVGIIADVATGSTILASTTVVVPTGKTLTVAGKVGSSGTPGDNVTLTNNGAIVVSESGTLAVTGAANTTGDDGSGTGGVGSIVGTGTLTVDGTLNITAGNGSEGSGSNEVTAIVNALVTVGADNKLGGTGTITITGGAAKENGAGNHATLTVTGVTFTNVDGTGSAFKTGGGAIEPVGGTEQGSGATGVASIDASATIKVTGGTYGG
jgi:hypothetical protein